MLYEIRIKFPHITTKDYSYVFTINRPVLENEKVEFVQMVMEKAMSEVPAFRAVMLEHGPEFSCDLFEMNELNPNWKFHQ